MTSLPLSRILLGGLCICAGVTNAFSTSSSNNIGRRRQTLSLLCAEKQQSTATNEQDNNDKSTTNDGRTVYPPLSREEVQSLLDNIPLYSVTDSTQEGGLVLLKRNDDYEIANFFLFPENANAKFAPFKKDAPLAKWEVTQYPLGLVWFELILSNNNAQQQQAAVEYRLVPNKFDIASAKNILVKQQQQDSTKFDAPYNEIPVFLDPILRVTDNKQQEQKFPLYLGYEEMSQAAQQAARATNGAYNPSGVTVMDLNELIQQMMTLESEIDFRNAIFVPPTPPSQTIMMNAAATDSRGSNTILNTPTAEEDLWAD